MTIRPNVPPESSVWPPKSFASRMFLTTSLLAILLAGIKLAVVASWGPGPTPPDAVQYLELGRSVAAGDVWLMDHPIGYRTPAYPWFIGLFATFSRDPGTALVIAQAVLQALTMILAASLGTQLTVGLGVDRRWAFATTLWLLTPTISSTVYVNVALGESLFTFLLLLHLVAVLAVHSRPTKSRAAWAGITLGVALLSRPIVMLVWLPHAMLTLWPGRGGDPAGQNPVPPWWRIGRRWLLAAGLVGLVLCPWMVRNRVLFGDAFLTQFVGRNLWIVTFQPGSGAGLPLPDSPAAADVIAPLGLTVAEANADDPPADLAPWRLTWTVSRALDQTGVPDPDIDAAMKSVAWDAARQSPVEFAFKAFRRCVNFWRATATDLPVASDVSGWTGSWIDHRWSQSLGFNTLLLLVMLASWLVLLGHPETRARGLWVGGVLAYFAVVTGVLEIPDYRYRMVVEPVVAATIGAAAVTLASRFFTVPRSVPEPESSCEAS